MAESQTTSLTNLTAINRRILKLRFGREVLTPQTKLLGFDLQGCKPNPTELSHRPRGWTLKPEAQGMNFLLEALQDASIHLKVHQKERLKCSKLVVLSPAFKRGLN